MTKLILRNHQAVGDILMLTAAVRDLHLCHPRQFITDVRTPFPGLWLHNPFRTAIPDDDAKAVKIECHYPLIHACHAKPYHFVHGFQQYLSKKLKLRIEPTVFHADLHFSLEEKEMRGQVAQALNAEVPYWIIAAGGKYDCSIKWWQTGRWQQVVDCFCGRILFVQVGEATHHHPRLERVLDLRGKTTLRQLILLVYHAQGVLCPITSLMHLAAGIPSKQEAEMCQRIQRRLFKPCVVVAGGREPAHWTQYPGHQFIHTVGALPCCAHGGCWKSRTVPLGDDSKLDAPSQLCTDVVGSLPRCMDMIRPEHVIDRVESYFRGGSCRYLNSGEAAVVEKSLAEGILEKGVSPKTTPAPGQSTRA